MGSRQKQVNMVCERNPLNNLVTVTVSLKPGVTAAYKTMYTVPLPQLAKTLEKELILYEDRFG